MRFSKPKAGQSNKDSWNGVIFEGNTGKIYSSSITPATGGGSYTPPTCRPDVTQADEDGTDALDIWYYMEGDQPLELPIQGLSWPIGQPYQWTGAESK